MKDKEKIFIIMLICFVIISFIFFNVDFSYADTLPSINDLEKLECVEFRGNNTGNGFKVPLSFNLNSDSIKIDYNIQFLDFRQDTDYAFAFYVGSENNTRGYGYLYNFARNYAYYKYNATITQKTNLNFEAMQGSNYHNVSILFSNGNSNLTCDGIEIVSFNNAITSYSYDELVLLGRYKYTPKTWNGVPRANIKQMDVRKNGNILYSIRFGLFENEVYAYNSIDNIVLGKISNVGYTLIRHNEVISIEPKQGNSNGWIDNLGAFKIVMSTTKSVWDNLFGCESPIFGFTYGQLCIGLVMSWYVVNIVANVFTDNIGGNIERVVGSSYRKEKKARKDKSK